MVPCGTLILPYLYLGDESDASDPDKLKSHNIYYVLNVTADLPGDGESNLIRYKRIPARDSFDQNLAQYFEESFQFIEEARQAGRAVLIHCHAGISRSPTIVVAYLMYSQNMTFNNAYKFVESKRPIISPNFSFVGQLYEYGKTQLEPAVTLLTPSSSTISTPTNNSSSLPPLLPTITTTTTVSSSNSPLSSSPSPSSSTTTTLTCSTTTTTVNTTSTSNGTSSLPILILPTPASTPQPPPSLPLVNVKTTSNGKTLLSPISLVTNSLSATTITTSISAPTTPTSPMPLPAPAIPTTPIITPMPTTPTNRSYLKISDTLNKPFFLQPPPPPSNPLKDGLVKPDVLPSSCEALSDIPYNSLGPVRGCRSRKSCNNDFILLRPIKMTKNTRVK